MIMDNFRSLNLGFGSLLKLSRTKSLSISAENFTRKKR